MSGKAWAWPLPPLEFPSYSSEGWILDEDRAVRDLMKGMRVTDYEDRSRPVGAWFGHPDQELREQKYPYVTIDLLQIQEATERTHRGHLYIANPPEWWGLQPLKPWQVAYLLEMPTPIDLDYQISTWARNPRHDRQIIQQLITGGRTMLRNGLLYTADKRIRRLDVLGHMKRDTVEGGKRLFSNVIRIRVSSEVPWGVIDAETDNGFGSVHSVLSKIRNAYDQQIDEAGVFVARVASYDPMERVAEIRFPDGNELSGVRVSRTVPDLSADDLVGVLVDPDEGGRPSGGRAVIVSIEGSSTKKIGGIGA